MNDGAALAVLTSHRYQTRRPVWEGALEAGHLTWADYRPLERPNAVRILPHKTGKRTRVGMSPCRGVGMNAGDWPS
jgi:hypothetical protein